LSYAWSLAVTAPQRESFVAEYLLRHGYTFHWFRERYTVARQGRLITALKPLFPSYIFVRARNDWQVLRERTAIIGFVSFGGIMANVGERLIADLQRACPDDIAPQREIPCRYKKGDAVDIIGSGPFAGNCGVFLRTISEEQSVVWVDMFGRAVPVTIDTELLLEHVPGARTKKAWRSRKRRRTRAWQHRHEPSRQSPVNG